MNKSNNTQNLQVYLAMLGGLSFMCFSAIFVKSAHAPGIVTAFYRMFIGSLVLVIPFIYFLKKSNQKLPVKGVILAISGGICFGCDMALWSTAVVMSNATLPTLMANLAPLWVALAAIVIFREKNNTYFWTGLILAIGGVILLVSKDISNANSILKGALLGLGAGFFYAVFYLVSQSGRLLINTLSYLFLFTISSAVFLFIVMLLCNYNFTGYDQHTRLMFLGIGVGVQVCGWMLINYAQGFLPATIVAPTLLGQPALVAILAIVLLNERLTVWHISSGLIVLSGIYLVNFSRRK